VLGKLWYSGADAVDEVQFTSVYIIKPTYKWKNYDKPGLNLTKLDSPPLLKRLQYRQQVAQTEFALVGVSAGCSRAARRTGDS
jgi:hypothetical protein